jgi:hypothetical protein
MKRRGTRDYGMCDVDFESNLVLTFICVVGISHFVVACSPDETSFQGIDDKSGIGDVGDW